MIATKLESYGENQFDLGNLKDKENDLHASTKAFIDKEVKGEMGKMFTM